MTELLASLTPMQWFSIGVLVGLMMLLLSVVGGNSIDPAERARDDEAQARDVSQPAALEHPHVKAYSSFEGPLQ
jgi:hypothetical protein